MTETEIWKEIPNYEGRYEASTWGNIRSIMGKEPRILKLNVYAGNPYQKVSIINKSGKRGTPYVHKLVYETHIGPVPDGLVIDHINGIKTDNRVENLRAVTITENCNNPVTKGNYKNRKHDPGEHERRSRGQKERFARPEELEKHRERLKKAWRKRKRRSRKKD